VNDNWFDDKIESLLSSYDFITNKISRALLKNINIFCQFYLIFLIKNTYKLCYEK